MLDSSALLALINQESGDVEVAKHIIQASISAINLSEVVAKLVDAGMALPVIRAILGGLGLKVHPFDSEMAYEVGRLRADTRQLGLSLGDRACLALGRSLGLPVLTMDRAWARLSLGVEVRVLR